MSKLYKKVTLFVSRNFYHGGEGLERGGLAFFRSLEEYRKLAQEHGWDDTSKSFHQSWCCQPIEMTGFVVPKTYRKFLAGEAGLSPKDVLFEGPLVDKVKAIGGW
tara:strand:+ start:5192 stop:5506 length:315 start_codon:yes stop_codon:yes gene_type:complete